MPVKIDGIYFFRKFPEVFPGGIQIGVFDRRGDVDLGATAADQASEGFFGQSCSSMNHNRCVDSLLQLGCEIKIDLRCSLVNTVRCSDRGCIGIDPGFPDKIDGILQAGERGVIRGDLHCILDTDDPAELAFYLDAFSVGVGDHLPAAGNIVLHRQSGPVIHDRVPACVDTGFCQFHVLAVVQMDEHVHRSLLRDLPQHRAKPHRSELFHSYHGCLQDDRNIKVRCRLYNRPCGQVVENIKGAHRISMCFCLQKLLQKCFLLHLIDLPLSVSPFLVFPYFAAYFQDIPFFLNPVHQLTLFSPPPEGSWHHH